MTWWLWVLLAIALAHPIVQVGLCFAPKAFWWGLDSRNSKWAAFLWGYSHLFGPRLRVGQVKPWLL